MDYNKSIGIGDAEKVKLSRTAGKTINVILNHYFKKASERDRTFKETERICGGTIMHVEYSLVTEALENPKVIKLLSVLDSFKDVRRAVRAGIISVLSPKKRVGFGDYTFSGDEEVIDRVSQEDYATAICNSVTDRAYKNQSKRKNLFGSKKPLSFPRVNSKTAARFIDDLVDASNMAAIEIDDKIPDENEAEHLKQEGIVCWRTLMPVYRPS